MLLPNAMKALVEVICRKNSRKPREPQATSESRSRGGRDRQQKKKPIEIHFNRPDASSEAVHSDLFVLVGGLMVEH
jgi:hypothetical protein